MGMVHFVEAMVADEGIAIQNSATFHAVHGPSNIRYSYVTGIHRI